MKILSIDTSSDVCSCALLEDEKVIKEINIKDGFTHSVNLMPQIDTLLSFCNLTINDIDLFACDKGPGSFTGIRIGIATIKAFCDVTFKPSIGISSLHSLAYNSNSKGYVCSLIDAKNNNAYYCLFHYSNGTYEQVGDYSLDNINNITEILRKYDNKITFIGNGSIVYEDVIKSILNGNAIFSNNNDLIASSIGSLAFYVYSNNIKDDFYNLSPLYLRQSSAERLLHENN